MSDIVIFGEAVQDRNVSIVRISADINLLEDMVVVSTGSSRREPSDKIDYEIGYQLALARALENLSHRILKQVNGAIKHRDDLKQIQLNQLIKKLEAISESTEVVVKKKEKMLKK